MPLYKVEAKAINKEGFTDYPCTVFASDAGDAEGFVWLMATEGDGYEAVTIESVTLIPAEEEELDGEA